MWLNTTISDDTEHCDAQTIFSEKTAFDDIAIKHSEKLGNVLYANDKPIFCQNDSVIYNEMFVHTPICVQPDPKNVLMLGYNSGAITELLKHQEVLQITVIESDDQLINAIKTHFDTSKEHQKVKIVNASLADFFADRVKFEVVLVNEFGNFGQRDRGLYQFIANTLTPDGVAVFPSTSWWANVEEQKATVEEIAPYFKILMPYAFHSLIKAGGMGNFLFVSKKFHPTADVILHRADLIDDLSYYNSDWHKASFCLPTAVDKYYRNILKK